jgi:hypothetical protein
VLNVEVLRHPSMIADIGIERHLDSIVKELKGWTTVTPTTVRVKSLTYRVRALVRGCVGGGWRDAAFGVCVGRGRVIRRHHDDTKAQHSVLIGQGQERTRPPLVLCR